MESDENLGIYAADRLTARSEMLIKDVRTCLEEYEKIPDPSLLDKIHYLIAKIRQSQEGDY